MANSRFRSTVAASVAAIVLGVFGGGGAAFAEGDQGSGPEVWVSSALAHAESAQSLDTTAAHPDTSTNGAGVPSVAASLDGSGVADISIPAGGVYPDGLNLSVTMPTDGLGAPYTTADDTTVFDSSSQAVTLATSQAGHVRSTILLADSSAPTTYTYTIEDALPVLNDDGSVALTTTSNGSTFMVGQIEVPWAVDATGQDVPTHFIVNGQQVTQVVEHTSGSYTYPIAADPDFGFTGIYFIITHTGAETRAMRAHVNNSPELLGLLAATCLIVPQPVGAICGLLMATYITSIQAALEVSGKCLQLRIPWVGPVILTAKAVSCIR